MYLAHPIDQARPGLDPITNAVRHLQAMAYAQGVSLFRPAAAHRIGASGPVDDLVKVDNINRHAIWESDGVIAILPPGVPTLGTPAEVEHALMLNRPVAILTTPAFAANSVQIAAWQKRGVQVRHMTLEGHVSELDIADLLDTLPDPTLLVSDAEAADGPEPMLITGEAANAQQGKYQGDAGIDLAIAKDTTIPAGCYSLIPTGVRGAIPDGYFGLITGRSSTWARFQCDVRTAIIDSGYRGELMVGIENRSAKSITFEAGMRLAQIILLPAWGGQVKWVEELPEHERGLNGYGSSGR